MHVCEKQVQFCCQVLALQGSVENSVVLAALVEVLIMDRDRHRAGANMAERASTQYQRQTLSVVQF